ncbi:MAG: hypothetical protein MJZ64_07555 [Paludibacteraceae bacterium]|nr:hypothetical protein [Paludibacteraceae bacterium]
MKAWTTRDADGAVFVNINVKPEKLEPAGIWTADNGEEDYIRISDSDLPEGINPQWSDDEPIEIKLKLERVNK